MKRCLSLMAVLLAFALSMPAQDAAASKSSSSDQAAKKAQKSATKDSAGKAKESQLTGCLGQASGGSGFVLTNGRYTSGVAVTPAAGVDLAPHSGHQVKLMGSWEKATDPKTKSFTASSVKHIAAQCPAAGAKKQGGKKGSKSDKTSGAEAPKS